MLSLAIGRYISINGTEGLNNLQNFIETTFGPIPEDNPMFKWDNDEDWNEFYNDCIRMNAYYLGSKDEIMDAEIDEFEKNSRFVNDRFSQTKKILEKSLVDIDYSHGSDEIGRMLLGVKNFGLNKNQYDVLVSIVEKRIKKGENSKKSLKMFRKVLKNKKTSTFLK